VVDKTTASDYSLQLATPKSPYLKGNQMRIIRAALGGLLTCGIVLAAAGIASAGDNGGDSGNHSSAPVCSDSNSYEVVYAPSAGAWGDWQPSAAGFYYCFDGHWQGPLTGPVGPTGATGATGATGPAGATGASGETGASGAKGSTGATGSQGASGAAGAAGATGAQGAAGTNGTNGSSGLSLLAPVPNVVTYTNLSVLNIHGYKSGRTFNFQTNDLHASPVLMVTFWKAGANGRSYVRHQTEHFSISTGVFVRTGWAIKVRAVSPISNVLTLIG
jgi:Collagen triple helix repeat (20 copies)